MAFTNTKMLTFILATIICTSHFCVPMMNGTGSSLSPKSVVKSPSADVNRKGIPNSPTTIPSTRRHQSFSALRTYGHNSLLYNFQTYNEDLKYPKNQRKSCKISNQILSNSKQFFSNGRKIRFNYGNQLKIMLQNCIEYERKRTFLSLEILGTVEQRSPGQGYNVLALKAAVKKEEEILMGPKIGGFEHVLSIANAMWTVIKELNSAAVSRIKNEVLMEQLRFIGLVMAHLVLRDDPIVDPNTGDYVFIAQMEPSIDPIDPGVWQQMRQELDTQLRALLSCQHVLIEERELVVDSGGILAEDKELFEVLNTKMMRDGIYNAADRAKWLELMEKIRLISLCHHRVPHYNLIFRTFIAFGDAAPTLILLVRVLLEGAEIDQHQFEDYLANKSGADLLKYIHHHTPSEMMSNQLKTLAKEFGF